MEIISGRSVKKTVSIRPAEGSDLEAAKKLLKEVRLPTAGLGDENRFVGDCVVATFDTRLVGLAVVESYGPFGLLRSVAVAPEFRGIGLGGRLVENRLGFAARKRMQAVYLLTMDAPTYFERFGFEVVERDLVPVDVRQSPEFSSVCPVTATAMVVKCP